MRTSNASEPRERSGDHGARARERVWGAGGAKPGLNEAAEVMQELNREFCMKGM